MDPQHAFCPNLDCPARGQAGRGTIRVHSQKEQRYLCMVCGHTFAATTGTPFYRLQTEPGLVLVVLSLLSWGCPVQAIVATFLLDERTVAAWLQRAGQHGQQVHQHLVQQGQVELQHVQADELWVKVLGRRLWMAMALAVPSRLWLGGVTSRRRDGRLIAAVVRRAADEDDEVGCERHRRRLRRRQREHDPGEVDPRGPVRTDLPHVQVLDEECSDDLHATRNLPRLGFATMGSPSWGWRAVRTLLR